MNLETYQGSKLRKSELLTSKDYADLITEEDIDVWALMSWEEGNLDYLLKSVQSTIRQKIFAQDGFKYFIKCSRRLGKSFLLCLLAFEACIRKPGARVRYGAGTLDSLREIVEPIITILTEQAPPQFRPEYIPSRKRYVFPNGSVIVTTGLDIKPDRLRGPWCDLFIIDEGGIVEKLKYIITDIALPQFLDANNQIVKGRKLIVAGTPPRTPAHDFTELCQKAELEGNYFHATIYEAGYPEETIKVFCEEAGGAESSTWRREYLAQDVVDENYAIVPEWKDEYVEEPHIDEFFPLYLKYDSLDIGVRDNTALELAHYDFKKGILYFHDEFCVAGPMMTTKVVADNTKALEARVWGSHQVTKRVSDIDLLLIQDLSILHNLSFIPTDKGKLEEMVNELRIWVRDGRIRVSKNCKQLIGCLRYGVWNENRTKWERVEAYGHFDALAAAMYLIRNVDSQFNPIPRNYGKREEDFWLAPEESQDQKLARAFGKRGHAKSLGRRAARILPR